MKEKGFSVIMPVYNQATFIRRAIKSLYNQTYNDWELIIINDGSTDEIESYIQEFLSDKKINYLINEENKGLGYAINQGLNVARYEYIAYLPADDFFYNNHLEVFYEEFQKSENTILTFSSAKSEINDSITYDNKVTTNGLFNFLSLQLVQTSHKNTSDRWITRQDWVTDDLFDLFWNKLIDKGVFTNTKQETAIWSIHQHQHHRLVSENHGGGLNIYRQYYNVKEPIKIKISKHKFINESELYKNFQIPKIVNKQGQLKILIVGELAYNSERIFALEEDGHQLYGLWMDRPTFSFNTVGPLPFGNVEDIAYENWEQKVKEIKPDIIYGTLNVGAVPLAYEVLRKVPDIPFVWHFKEGPFLCLKNRTWEKLIYLYHHADGKIYLNKECKEWYEQFIPQTGLSFILDGDLPKMNFFTENFSNKISDSDGGIHTVVPGRIVGLSIQEIEALAKKNIHIHLYVENYYASRETFSNDALRVAPAHYHTHPHVGIDKWVKEFSKYDAGWLHCFDSQNKGDISVAGWNDLNMPARMNTLAAAGLPMIQKDNNEHIVAMQQHLKKRNMGIFYKDIDDLVFELKDKEKMNELRQSVLRNRYSFSFDYHVPELINFFREVIKSKIK